MLVHIINLEHRIEKKQWMESMLQSFNVKSYRFIEGTNGSKLTNSEIKERYNGSVIRKKHQRDSSPAEIGVALSHNHIYQELLNSNENATIVLEDDIMLTEEFANICNLPFPHIDAPVVCMLYGCVHRINESHTTLHQKGTTQTRNKPFVWNRNDFITIGDHRFHKIDLHMTLDIAGAAGYIINRAAAERILRVNSPVSMVCDMWNDITGLTDIELFVTPHLICPAIKDINDETKSDIAASRKNWGLGKMKYDFL